MWASSLTSGGLRIVRYSRLSLPLVPSILFPSSSSTLLANFRALAPMDDNTINSFASVSISSKSGGRGRGGGRGLDVKDNHGGRGRGVGGSGTDKIDALGRLMYAKSPIVWILLIFLFDTYMEMARAMDYFSTNPSPVVHLNFEIKLGRLGPSGMTFSGGNTLLTRKFTKSAN